MSEERLPIFSSLRLTLNPGLPFSTTNMEIPRARLPGGAALVRAATK